MEHSTLVVHRVTAIIFMLICLMLDAEVSEHLDKELAGPALSIRSSEEFATFAYSIAKA